MWSKMTMPQPCQRAVDAKAFTGRGESPMSLRKESKRLRIVHDEMAQLSRLTRDIPGRTFYLQVHNRAEYGQKTLRWRKMGVKGGHIAWTEVHSYFAKELPAMRDWYIQVHNRALSLNIEEKSLRRMIAAYAAAQIIS